MAFASIEDLLKSKNPQDPNDPTKPKDPNDPNAPKEGEDPDAEKEEKEAEPPFKPFGDHIIDPLTGNPIFGASTTKSGLRASIGDQHSGHKAVILKQTYEDGKVKLYQDSKGLAERTDMVLDNGKVVVYKDYDYKGGMARYKKVEVYSIDDELLGVIKLFPRDHSNPRPVYRFFYDQTEIGIGNGDIALFIAQELVSRTIQSRSGVGTSVDGEVISTIKNILHNKR